MPQVLFASDTDLSTPARLVCLDGVVVHRSEDKRPFVVEARRSIFQEVSVVLVMPNVEIEVVSNVCELTLRLGMADERRPGAGC